MSQPALEEVCPLPLLHHLTLHPGDARKQGEQQLPSGVRVPHGCLKALQNLIETLSPSPPLFN